ncbi:MAG: transcriptional regulator [Clostridia bacterium]|nr:transcriptional regulator [Clostridia bacterium]
MEERFQKFTVLVTAVGRCIHKIKTEEMAEFDLKSSHVSCLYYLYKDEPLTAKELCDICEEDKANVSRSIKFLEETGYLACSSKHQKRYQSPIHLTEKGREIGQRIAAKIDRILELASEGLSEEHRAIFYNSFSLIMGNLQRICDGYEAAPDGSGA